MDKEEFESKLRLARRQKEQAEQELETASEKWRAERRRLNSEIDRLESALAEAKESPRRRGAEVKSKGIDPVEVAKIQASADEKLKKAAKDWETERETLKKHINRLEQSLAETIERSNNPLRSTQGVRQQFETQIVELTRRRDELERTYARDKTDWAREKEKLNAELTKLRRTAEVLGRPLPEPAEPAANPRIKELEKQIQESTVRWENERRQLNAHAGQLQQAFVAAEAKLRNYEAASVSNEHYEAQLKESKLRVREKEQELEDAHSEWNAQRKRLSADIERLEEQLQRKSENRERISNDIVEQLRSQYEQKLQEAIDEKIQLSEELQNATAMLESERARLREEMSKAKVSSAAAGKNGGNTSVSTEAIDAELARVEKMIREIGKLIDDPATDLSTVIRKNVERAELDAYLKGILFSIGKGRGL